MTDTTATGTLEQALAHAERLLDSDPVLAGVQATEILKVAEGQLKLALATDPLPSRPQHALPGGLTNP